MNAIHSAPSYNLHLQRWENGEPSLPGGPIEVYEPIKDGTEDLPPDANFEVEFRGEYPTIEAAIRDLPHLGRYMWSTPSHERYLGFLNHCAGSVALITY